MDKCPLCGKDADVKDKGFDIWVDCENCGKFHITSATESDIQGNFKNDAYKISSYTKESYLLGRKTPFIVPKNDLSSQEYEKTKEYEISVEEIINDKFPKSISEILDRSLLNIFKVQGSDFGKWIEIDKDCKNWNLFYSNSWKQVQYILNTLISQGLLEADPHQIEIIKYMKKDIQYSSSDIEKIGYSKFRLAFNGWNRVAELERGGNIESNQVFMAMWFDNSMDEVWENGFKKAIEEVGLKPLRIDEKEHNNKIDDEIIIEIKKSICLIADFTKNRGGVYYEAGFAKGLGIPVIFACRSGEEKDLHFDIRQYNHIIWENSEDLRKRLKNRIRTTITSSKISLYDKES